MLRNGPIAGLLCLVLASCHPPKTTVAPTIEFTHLPAAGDGSPDKLDRIEGLVHGGAPGQRVVLFARSGVWWVQPTTDHPFTELGAGSTWRNSTHPGSAYAALLVNASYRPPPTLEALPKIGGNVLAVATVEGPALSRPPPKTLQFSGYEWEIRAVASDRGGTRNQYATDNAWTDEHGFLHLRILRKGDTWTSAEVSLTRSLGYGSYRFVTRDVSQLEPAAVLSFFTWDDAGPPREMDIEISRWGEASSKNAQYVIQPYHVPANVVRFVAPGGMLTHWLRWEPGRAAFTTVRGSTTNMRMNPIAEHAFSSGVPAPGKELIHMNLYVFDNKSNPLRNSCEVIIEKFEHLP